MISDKLIKVTRLLMVSFLLLAGIAAWASAAQAAVEKVTTYGSEGSGAGQFLYPEGLAVDRQGNMYVADKDNDRIVKLAPDGSVLWSYGSRGTGPEHLNFPSGVGLDSSGNVYIADNGNERIVKLSPYGERLRIYTSPVEKAFQRITRVVVNAEGYIYVKAWDGIKKIDQDGGYLRTFGRMENIYGYEIERDPGGLALDASGNIYVSSFDSPYYSDSYTGEKDFVIKYDADGNYVMHFELGASFMEFSQGISEFGGLAVDANGYIYANYKYDNSRTYVNRIEKFDPTGVSVEHYDVIATDYHTQFLSYGEMALDASGHLYVADQGKHQIAKYNFVRSDANLRALTLSNGSVSPIFAPGTTSYTASVGNGVSSITVTPTLADHYAEVRVNGTAVTSGTASAPINLNVGANPITVQVTAQNGTTKTYTVRVTRAPSGNADLSGLSLSSGSLNPAFAGATTGYTADVGNEVSSIAVTPTVAESHATVRVNGGAPIASGTASAPINLNVGANPITVQVTAQDGTTTKTYTVTVTRAGSNNADLSGLVLSGATLHPAFAPDTVSYSVYTAEPFTRTWVTPITADDMASVQVNGTAVSSQASSIAVELATGTNTIEVIATAENGTEKKYTIVVERVASPKPVDVSLNSNVFSYVPGFDRLTVTGSIYAVSAGGSLSLHYDIIDSQARSVTSAVYGISTGEGNIPFSQSFEIHPAQFPAGEYTLRVTVKDVYNAPVVRTLPFGVQTEPPALLLTMMKADGGIYTDGSWTNQTVTASVYGTKSPASMVFSVNGGPSQPYVNGSVLTLSEEGRHTLTFQAVDQSGNTSMLPSKVNIDRTPPVITLVGQPNITLTVGDVYTEPGANAADNVAIDGAVSVTGSVDTGTEGTYTLRYNVFDLARNAAAEATRLVTVQPVPTTPEDSNDSPADKAASLVLSDVEIQVYSNRSSVGGLDGIIVIKVPEGAVSSDGTIRVAVLAEDEAPPAEGLQALSKVLEFSSTTGRTFHQPLELAFHYDAAQLPPGAKPAVYYYNEQREGWLFLGGTARADGTTTIQIDHFTKYGVFAQEPKTFVDLADHWAAVYTERLIEMNVIQGFEDQTFRPEEKVTRTEFAKMLVRALGIRVSGTSPKFDDESEIPAWAKQDIAAAVEAGIINGYHDNGKLLFKGNQTITRAEMAAMIVRAIGHTGGGVAKDEEVSFRDAVRIPEWARGSVHSVVTQGIMTGYEDHSFRPGQAASRAESAAILYRLLEKLYI
ncbi:cadherin-like beta sandwich domain-containing protein [Paenibacillus sp. TRM 82003]|nr:cadherin-like beta sandwich domain-containing protein [Paenibacillus sp. TRM 82003]